MKNIRNGVILDGKIYEAVEVDDITCKCCTGCAFEHDNETCPNDFGKYIQWKNKVGIIFKKVEDEKC